MSKPCILTGVRASGEIHLGNYLGAIQPAIARQDKFKAYFFVANYHGLTTTPSAQELSQHTRSIAATWLAAGLDPNKTVLWKQSDVPEVLELSYILSCVTSMGLLERAHSFKDAIAKQKNVKAGLFYYPVLMAADILLFNADFVPVGKDQQQHLEMTRDIATFFNEIYGETFKLPEALVQEAVGAVPGTDGRKMSKSYGNGIEILADEAKLKKQIMGIQTDSKTLEEPKDPDSCLIFQLYKLIAPKGDADTMRQKLLKGGFGYGDAKKQLLATILESFGPMRQEYSRLMKDPDSIDAVLKKGALNARENAAELLGRVRRLVGL